MEPIQSMDAFSYGDQWDPINILFTNEDLELTQMLLGQAPPGLDIPVDSFFTSPEEHMATPGMFEGLFNPELTPNTDSLMVSSSHEGSYATGFDWYYCPAGMSLSMEEKYNSGESFVPDFTDQLLGGESLGFHNDNNAAGVGDDVLVEQEAPMKSLQPKRKRSRKNLCVTQDEDADMPENPKKRKPRASKSDKGKKKEQPKKKQKLGKPNEEEGEEGNLNARQEGSSPCCSEEADSLSQDNRTAQNSDEVSVLNSDGKTTRASRGTATDPQSLYARRRRERINERLKILQNLVPNGTKVDISTMLEEAVHYVKFLQLQIKLLSSDEHWMYAPIAYNGMDIGLNHILPRHGHLS